MFHFATQLPTDQARIARLSCGRVAQDLAEHYRGALGLPAAHREVRQAAPKEDPGEDSEEDPEEDSEEDLEEVAAPPGRRVPAAAVLRKEDLRKEDLKDAALWGLVDKMQWALTCDRKITPKDARKLIQDLKQDGVLENIKMAFLRLSGAMMLEFPHLESLENSQLIQLVALGHELAIGVGGSPDLLLFAKKELQQTDLAALLWQ